MLASPTQVGADIPRQQEVDGEPSRSAVVARTSRPTPGSAGGWLVGAAASEEDGVAPDAVLLDVEGAEAGRLVQAMLALSAGEERG